MNEPITIDEMLETLRKLHMFWAGNDDDYGLEPLETQQRVTAIRAVLEQHQKLRVLAVAAVYDPQNDDKTVRETRIALLKAMRKIVLGEPSDETRAD